MFSSHEKYEEIVFSTGDALFQRQRLNYRALVKKVEEYGIVLGPNCFKDMPISTKHSGGTFDASVFFKEWVSFLSQDAVAIYNRSFVCQH